MLIAILCFAALSLVVVIVVQSRNVGPAIGFAALAMRLVYAFPGVRKPAELRIAACIKNLGPVLAEQAPSVRDHHTRRSKRDGHLQVSLIVERDSDLLVANARHDVILDALRARMPDQRFTDREIAEVRLDFVSAEEIGRLGGAFHYWREHGVE